MTVPYHVRPAAERDLDDLAAYLAQEAGLETALRFYDAVAATFEQIARSPGLGEIWKSTDRRLVGLRVRRTEGFSNHLVFYRPAPDGIEVVRVLHGARDADRVLRVESDLD